MLYQIQNDKLTVTIQSFGAELTSVKDNAGTEYMWQGDPAIWTGCSPSLFPTVGRLWKKAHFAKGKECPMEIHGFAKRTELHVSELEADKITFTLTDTPEIYAQYPYHFRYCVRYQLEGNRLSVTYHVENQDEETMHFGLGGHPGFRVPVFEGEEFEDYKVTFSEKSEPFRVGFSPEYLCSCENLAFPLENGDTVSLRHDLFDDDAIFLGQIAKSAALSGPKGTVVRVNYPDMNFVGLWHKPMTKAPYICIEPWLSLPGRQDVLEDFSKREDMVHLPPKESYDNCWDMEFTMA